MQNNETNPSHVSNTNQQSARSVLWNISKEQKITEATEKPDARTNTHQSWWANFNESLGQPQLAAPYNGACSMPDYGRNDGQADYNGNTGHHPGQVHPFNMPQMQRHQPLHQMPHQMPQQIPSQMTSQASMSLHIPRPIPFNPYGIQFPFLNYGAPTSESQHPFSYYPPNRVQVQAMQPTPAFQMNQNMPSPVISHTPSSSSAFKVPEPSRRYSPPCPAVPNIPTIITSLPLLNRTDTPGLKRRLLMATDTPTYESLKKPRKLTSASNDATTSKSPHLTKSNRSASKKVKDNNQINGKKVLDPMNGDDDDFTCAICQETRKDTVLIPCRHLCLCEKCADTVVSCPLCREEFKETLTVFT